MTHLPQRITRLRHIVLDMDGTIYLGGTLFPATLPFLTELSRLEIGYTFVTNNCSKSRAQYVERLRGLGIHIEPHAISTSAHATIFYLQTHLQQVRRVFTMGNTGLDEDLRLGGYEVVDERPEAVIVGFDPKLTYDQLAQTAYWISQGLPYIATNPDRVCPTDRPIVLPDCGAFCAMFETATGRRPNAVPGKPSAAMLQAVVDRHGLTAAQVAMVGDRLYTDVRMALDAGALAVLTLTGEAQIADVDAAAAGDRPDLVIADLGELAQLLRQNQDG